MSQLKIEDYVSNENPSKLYVKVENIKESNIVTYIENVNNKEDIIIEEQINESSGIVEIIINDIVYKTWTVKHIRPLVINFLKEKYSDSLVVREINRIDLILIDNQSEDILPVEIQRTPISSSKTFSHTLFEGSIRTQLDINVESYGKCWFFFDSEYLRFLQSTDVGKTTSINMTWLVKLMKKEKLKTFVIRHDGEVRELTTKDFDFLKGMSQICIIEHDGDERMLDRNKLKIYRNVIRGHNFTQEEITKFESDFDNRNNSEYKVVSRDYYINSNNEKCKLYGKVIKAIGNLLILNNVLSCTSEGKEKRAIFGVVVGLFEMNDFHGNNNNSRIQFVDKFNIAQYFPGYLRNKEMWKYCKKEQRVFTMNEFRGIVEGREHCLKLIKNQSTQCNLEDYK